MEGINKNAINLCIILALMVARVTSYNPSPSSSSYKLGRISYYEEDPSLKTYRKRVADEPYRALQSAFLTPAQLNTDEELAAAGMDYMSLVKQMLVADEAIPQRSQRSQQEYYPPPPPPAVVGQQEDFGLDAGDITEAEKDAFLKYLSDNAVEDDWTSDDDTIPAVADYNIEDMMRQQELLPAGDAPVVAKKPPGFLARVLGNTFKPLPIARSADTHDDDLEASTTTTPPATVITTTVAEKTSTEIKATTEEPTTSASTETAIVDEKSENQDERQAVESSIVDTVKRFLIQRHNEEMHKTKRATVGNEPHQSVFTSTKDLLKSRSYLDRHA